MQASVCDASMCPDRKREKKRRTNPAFLLRRPDRAVQLVC
jgi:hypothetical protein